MNRIVMFGSLSLLLAYYVLSIVSILSLHFNNPLHQSTAVKQLQKHSANNLLFEPRVMTLLYKNDSEILFLLCKNYAKKRENKYLHFCKSATVNDPYNLEYASKYMDSLIRSDHKNEFYTYLLYLTNKWNPNVNIDLLNNIPHDQLPPVDFLTSFNFSSISQFHNLDKIHYLIGLELLEEAQELTEMFWQVARDINPWLGHHYTELYSLYTHIIKDSAKINQLIMNCNRYASAINECNTTVSQGVNIPLPGFMKSYILNYL
jgi:hypothetical protein